MPQQSAKIRAGPATADDVRIEHLADGSVVIRKPFSEARRRKSTKAAALVCAVLGVAVFLVWMLYRRGSVSGFVAVVAGAFALSIVPQLLRQFAMGTRSYVIRAARGGLTIDTTTWRTQTTRQFTADEILDIVPDCSGGVDPRHTVFRTFLVIQPAAGRAIRCLHNVSGDRLAAVADALRAAIGLAARSWP